MQTDPNFNGDLDLASRSLEKVAPILTSLWNEGRYRMRRDEIRRVREHLARASKAQKDIKAVLALFEEIASVPNAEKHIETPEESLGLVPARLIEVSSH